jgi:hypothetical protein
MTYLLEPTFDLFKARLSGIVECFGTSQYHELLIES